MKKMHPAAHNGRGPTRGAPSRGEPPDAKGLVSVHRGHLPLLALPHLAAQSGLVHAITTRAGGVSRPPHQSLNLSRSGDDAPAAVAENRRRLQRALAPGRLVFSRQVHGAAVAA